MSGSELSSNNDIDTFPGLERARVAAAAQWRPGLPVALSVAHDRQGSPPQVSLSFEKGRVDYWTLCLPNLLKSA